MEKKVVELRIKSVEDRRTVMGILADNGYDVGLRKRKVKPTGRSVMYVVHAVDNAEGLDTSDEE